MNFKAEVVKEVWNSDNFKVYAVNVTSCAEEVETNKYGNVSISGNIPDLIIGEEYEFSGEEKKTKYGIGYDIQNVKRKKPTTKLDASVFLSEILTQRQTNSLLSAYPNIIDMIMDGEDDKIDFSKLNGIKEKSFQKIKDKVIDNFCLAEFVSEFDGLITIATARKLYEKYKSIEMMNKKFLSEPYKTLCEVSGIGFKKADSILLSIDKSSKQKIKKSQPVTIKFDFDLKASKERCLAYIVYALTQNESEGNTKMNLADLRTDCLKNVPETISYFEEAIKDKSVFYETDSMTVSRTTTHNTEKYISNVIRNAFNNNQYKWKVNEDDYKEIDGFVLTNEQTKIISTVCQFPISILNGSAGTGKTSSTLVLIEMLNDGHKAFKLMSPTGKAAKRLSECTKERATTLHRGLGYRSPDEWAYNEEEKFDCDIIIIDEFSMVDIWMFKRVLSAIDFNKTKLLLIGDDAQLPSIGAGNILHDLINSKFIPTVTLTKIFRYGEGGLMRVADDVKNTKQYLSKDYQGNVIAFGENKDYIFIKATPGLMKDKIVNLYGKLLEKGYSLHDIQVLTAKNVGDCGTIALNKEIQKIANKNYGCIHNIKIGESVYYVGDSVIQKINNYKATIVNCNTDTDSEDTCLIANGETGTIKKIDGSDVYIDFDGVLIKYTRDEMSMVGLGYAISIHKSQGSGFKIVILCSPKSDIYMMNSNLLYVGITRTIEKCYHVGSIAAVNMAVKKKENFKRDTYLKDFLIK